jgi:hypothetical protein
VSDLTISAEHKRQINHQTIKTHRLQQDGVLSIVLRLHEKALRFKAESDGAPGAFTGMPTQMKLWKKARLQ